MSMIETELYGNVGILTLNRGVINAINRGLVGQLSENLDEMKENPDVYSLSI